jgi:small GTP-binding protein
MQKILAIPS